MKVGILTFMDTMNYGAELQMYGMFKSLIEMGHQVEVIDYSCSIINERENPYNRRISSPRQFIWRLLVKHNAETKWNNFRYFERGKIAFTEHQDIKSIGKKLKEFDAVIVGSDQIWNPDNVGNDNVYLLPFDLTEVKKISYAASFGFNADNQRLSEYLKNKKELFLDFDSLSVREEEGQQIIKKYLNLDSEVVLDPTFLITKEDWSELENQGDSILDSYIDKPFILVYGLNKDSRMKVLKKAKEMRKRNGLDILWLGSNIPVSGVKTIPSLGPSGFIKAFDNASYVLTNSYHGTCFALIFKKQFQCIMESNNKNNTNSRMIGLLQRMNISAALDDLLPDNYDWSNFDNAMKTERNKSVQYLRNAIG